MKYLRQTTTLGTLVLSFVLTSQGALAQNDESPADLAQVAQAVAPALVRVEYTLKYDQGEPPMSTGMWSRYDQLVEEERPMELGGYLISPTEVVVSDPQVHPRFVEAIHVRQGDAVVPALPAGWFANESAILLKLDEELAGARPVSFDAAREDTRFRVTHGRQGAEWMINIAPWTSRHGVSYLPDAGELVQQPVNGLVVAQDGSAYGLTFASRPPADPRWPDSPEIITTIEMQELLTRAEELATRGLLHVNVRFRSPRQNQSDPYGGVYPGQNPESETEWNGVGLLVDDRNLLINGNFKPKVTARLEHIRVTLPGGETTEAQFTGTLEDYGGFMARLDQPVAGAIALVENPITEYRDRLLLVAEMRVQGESRVTHYAHTHLAEFELGWKRHINPGVYGQHPTYLFSPDGSLVAAPLERRQKVTVEDQWGYGYGASGLTATHHIVDILARPEDHFDTNNVPLSEEEENRLAWLGVELQALDTELARANGVSRESNDGAFGGMVTYIYSGSPAERAGIELGDIVLRLHIPDQPRPLEVQVMGDRFGFAGGFPWDELDQVPEQYFDRIPTPWAPRENTFTRALTDVGFGTEYTAEIFRNGEIMTIDFTVELSPAHYGTAAKREHKPSGITVREMTYEVRRYFQHPEEEPGVIVSKIEPGSRASVAGLKPYEIVTELNDQPVDSVDAFETLVEGQTDLRFNVKRMTRNRIVKMTVDAPADEPE